jgi:hypothetical protein
MAKALTNTRDKNGKREKNRPLPLLQLRGGDGGEAVSVLRYAQPLDECQAGDGLDGDDHRSFLSDQLFYTAISEVMLLCRI